MGIYVTILLFVQAEVLGKRVVVQHIPLGGLVEWNVDPTTPVQISGPRAAASPRNVQAGDAGAPWLPTSMGPPALLGGARAPWEVERTSAPTYAGRNGNNDEVGSRR